MHKGIRLFLDTADTQQWEHWLPTGLFYGVTTNPMHVGTLSSYL
ncbi:hypothetical protein [Dulcicalothrix desertica]|nr:hypothetical protein [Dulcicalothrix desertica]